MSKKNKGNNKGQQQSPKPQTIKKVVKPEEEITIEEKERLLNDGKEQKALLIEEGTKEKNRLIGEGESEKKRIIEKAEKDAQKSIDEVQRQYKEEVKAEAITEAEEEKQRIIAEATARKEEVAQAKDELNKQLESIQTQYDELAVKMEEFVKNSAELESRKLSYKTEVLAEMNQQIQEFKVEIERIEEEKQLLEKALKAKVRELQSCTEDKEYYEKELSNTDARRQTQLELESKLARLESTNEALSKNYQECFAEKKRLEAEALRFGDNPTALMSDLTRLEKENNNLRDRLARMPSEAEIDTLRAARDNYDKSIAELKQLKNEKIEVEKKLQELDVYAADLENSRRFIRILELQRRELQTELDRIEENYNNRQENVFAALSAIDKEPIQKNHVDSRRSLKDICDGFRNYLASRQNNPLYYSQESIRTFFAGLASSHILILQGMSGTGKSSLPKAFEDFMFSETHRIEVQSSWKDRNDLLGFYNDFEKRYKETKFLECLYRSTRDLNNIHLIMLDEMNLSRIEYYFADFLSVLEEEREENWKINLISRDVRGNMPEYIQNGELPIRKNTWFIGTANKDDSTFTITDKVYDRAIVLNFEEREEEFSAQYVAPRGLSFPELNKLLQDAVQLSATMKKEIKETISDLDYMMKCDFEISFGNRISKQIEMFVPAYVKCGGTIEKAIDIIFATKVLRKLQGMYDESTKKGLNDFLMELNKAGFGSKMDITKNAIKKMIERM